MYYVTYRDIRSVGSTDEAYTHRHADRQTVGCVSRIMRGLLERKLSKNQILTPAFYSRARSCLSVAFEILKFVTLLQIRCEYHNDLGGTTT